MADDVRFIRWQEVTRKQLSYAINLILTFSVATLGFEASILLSEAFQKYNGCVRNGLLASFVLLGFSTLLGILATVSRLCDFRLTAKAIRRRSAIARQQSKEFGKATWRLFWAQVLSFSVAVVVVALSVFAIAIS